MAGGVFSAVTLSVASLPVVSSFVQRSPLVRPLVERFVAGDTLERALEASQRLNRDGMAVALDFLGENTTTPFEAQRATLESISVLDAVSSQRLSAYLSIKLTQLGLDLGEYLVLDHLRTILIRARASDLFVRIDMEGAQYTSRTIELFTEVRKDFNNVGIVLQACLYRSVADLRGLLRDRSSVRLVKGAYAEPAHIAFRRKRDTDRNYLRMLDMLLGEGTHPAIATHDSRMIDAAIDRAAHRGLSLDSFEFQMLYGIRRDLQAQLTGDGYQVRIYVPFGAQWYPYLSRRLAERPSNLAFVARSVAR